MKVELEAGVWLTTGSGDPPRTLVEDYATVYMTRDKAEVALAKAREYRPFVNAKIIKDKVQNIDIWGG